MPADARTICVENLEIIATPDGSQTLRDPASGITYRSTYGARTEARHVFVEGTRLFTQPGPHRVLELGLGGGTNFLETLCVRAEKAPNAELIYHAIERAPIAPNLARQLHQAEDPARAAALTILTRALAHFHQTRATRVEHHEASLGVTLVVHCGEWRSVTLQETFDAIYHDPFDPQVNEEAWTKACFGWVAEHMTDQALLTTYSAAGAVRRNLAAAGLYTGWRPGAGGKREMTAAAKSRDALSGYQLCSTSKQPPGFEP